MQLALSRAARGAVRTLCEPLDARRLFSGYTITDLGPGAASGLNDNGEVVGTTPGAGDTDGFYYSKNTGTLNISWGGDGAGPKAINNAGVIVGGADHGGNSFAFRMNIHDHDKIGGSDFTYGDSATTPQSGFNAIDNSFIGLSVGFNNNPTQHGIFYNGDTYTVSAANGDIINPLGIADYQDGNNDNTGIVGLSYGPHAAHAVYNSGSTTTDLEPSLDTDGNALGVATAISPNGKYVVGWSTITYDGSNVVAFRYDPTTHAIGILGHYYLGQAADVDNSGTVVGTMDIPVTANSPYVAFIDPLGGSPVDLNAQIPPNTGWTLTNATGINASGQVCGYGTLNGVQHAFLLTPDTTGPTVAANVYGPDGVHTGNVTTAGTFKDNLYVDFADPSGIKNGTVSADNFVVLGPNNKTATVSLTSVAYNPQDASVEYQIAAPGGSWDSGDNGTYEVALVGYSVFDNADNPAQGSLVATFTVNIPAATVKPKASGNVYRDANKNGTKDSGETNLAGVTVWLDLDNDKVIDSNEIKTTTDSSGSYTLSNLTGTSAARVRVQLPSGATQVTPSGGVGYAISFASGATNTGKNFGLYTAAAATKTASIAGFTFNDANKNGKYDSGDTLATGKTVWLDLDDDGKIDSGEPTATTDSHGNFKFTALAAGTYHVRRSFPSGYAESTPARRITLTNGQASTGVSLGSKTS